jgi:hypothetical protein
MDNEYFAEDGILSLDSAANRYSALGAHYCYGTACFAGKATSDDLRTVIGNCLSWSLFRRLDDDDSCQYVNGIAGGASLNDNGEWMDRDSNRVRVINKL